MKKILLINPWIEDFTAFDLWARPIGLLYLAGIINQYVEDKEIYFIDCLDRFSEELRKKTNIPKPYSDGRGKYKREIIEKPETVKKVPRKFARYGIPVKIFKDKLKQVGKPDIVLVTSIMTYWYPGVHRSIKIVKEIYPDTEVWLGGIYPKLLPDFARKYSKADFIIVNNSENKILPELRKRGFKVKNTPYFNSIDELPYPLYGIQSKHPYLPFITSLGCPFSCPYCATKILQPAFFGRNVRKLTKELVFYKKNFKINHIAFYDDALLINKQKRLFPLLDNLKNKGIEFNYHTPNGIHVNELDLRTTEKLKTNGFKTLRLSLEVGVENLLEKLAPKLTLEDFERAVFNLKKAGYKTRSLGVYILFGHPHQSKKDIEETFQFLEKFEIPIHLSFYSPIPGTDNFKDHIKKGILKKDDDPLIQNKISFLYLRSNLNYDEVKYFKDKQSKINDRLFQQ